jgi:Ethanolamine utilization protein EutJ (predicted chaperonin)
MYEIGVDLPPGCKIVIDRDGEPQIVKQKFEDVHDFIDYMSGIGVYERHEEPLQSKPANQYRLW